MRVVNACSPSILDLDPIIPPGHEEPLFKVGSRLRVLYRRLA